MRRFVAKRSQFKNKFLATIATITLLTPISVSVSFADAVSRAEDDLTDSKNAEKDAKRAWDKCKADVSRPSGEASACDGRMQDFMARKPVREKWTLDDEKEYSDIQSECRQKRTAIGAKNTECVGLQEQYEQAKQETKAAKRKADRAQEQADNADKKSVPGNENCVECKKEKDKYAGKSGWESFADVIKAATPLGLGAMNLYGGIKAMNLQSSDYQTYASSMSAAGLPFSQNTNGYGGILGSMMGGNNMLSMLSMMNSGSGAMGGSGMMGGMSGMSGGYGMMGGMSGMSGGYGMMGGMSGMMGGMSGMSGGYGMLGGIVGASGISGGMGMMGGMSGMMGGMSGMSGGYGMLGGIVGVSGISGGMGMMGGMSGYSGMGYSGGMSPYGNGMYGGMSGYNPYGGGYMGGGTGYNPYGAAGYGGGYMGGGGYPGGVASMYPASPYGYPGNAYPYANAFGGLANNNGFGGLTSYNPWYSNYNSQLSAGGLPSFYQNQQSQYAAQLRSSQQQAITNQDSQAAQQALYTAQTRYQQVLGNMNGSYSGTSYPYSTAYAGYGSGYGSSYYGGYGYNPYGYYNSGATVNNPPALNSVRQ